MRRVVGEMENDRKLPLPSPRPRFVVVELRIKELLIAIATRVSTQHEIPIGWLIELGEHAKFMKEIGVENL